MDPEFQEIEDTLKGLRPAMPGPACMDRLLAAVEGRLQREEPSMAGMEQALASLILPAVPAEAAGRMLATVERVPFPVDEKVVLFPGAAKPAAKLHSRRPWYAAAAAVAVAGAFSAFMVERPAGGDTSGRFAGNGSGISPQTPSGFVPAAVGSGLQDARDEGVMWTPDGKPVRMVRVIYMDRVKYQNERGEIIEVERPRVEYLMVPEKID
jgi:hypothetical protein